MLIKTGQRNDTKDSLLTLAADLIERAYAAGLLEGVAREKRETALKLGLSPLNGGFGPLNTKAASTDSTFGAISNTLRKVYGTGEGLAIIAAFNRAKAVSPNLTDGQLRSALKMLVKGGELAAQARGIYRATPKLLQKLKEAA